MREIKFRAWDTQTKSMFGPESLEGAARLCWGEMLDNHDSGKVILMQYTGLKDKNGKEIYEGDVVRGELPDHIKWDGKEYEIAKVKIDPAGVMPFYLITDYEGTHWIDEMEDFEIIGNIYENPELVKHGT